MESLLALVAATLVLVAIPGPNVALIVANSIRDGRGAGLRTVAGSTIGVGVQLLLITIGIAAMIELVAGVLVWLKWIGVAYLLFLGVRTWQEPASDLTDATVKHGQGWRELWSGLGVAVVNPKTLLFNAAFLPQFVSPGPDAPAMMMLVSVVFLATVFIGDTIWALAASAARPVLIRYGRLRNRITGGFLIGAGIGLALSRR